MKKLSNTLLRILLGVMLVAVTGCSSSSDVEEEDLVIRGSVKSIDEYGNIVPSFLPLEMLSLGFEYSDLLNIQIGNDIHLLNVPFTTGYTEVGVLDNSFCNYHELPTMLSLSKSNASFARRVGGVAGDTIIVTLAKKQGYAATYKLLHCSYSYNRSDYPDESDEEFANFREITTTGMAHGVLYRSSNPYSSRSNLTRSIYADSLARHYGLQTELDLADTPERLASYRQYSDFTSTYCISLYDNGQAICYSLSADAFTTEFQRDLGEELRFMLNHQPPYMLHCDEGKDRCGFVSMLLESFAGATYEDVADDYMKSFVNNYKMEADSEQYQFTRKMTIDRLVWLLANSSTLTDFSNIDWTGKDPTTVNLSQAAWDFILKCGLSADECTRLKTCLQTGQ